MTWLLLRALGLPDEPSLVLALDVAWQSALIFLSGELAARVLRRPGARYAIWMAALAGTVVTPMATGWLRSLEVANPVLHTGAPLAVEVLDTGGSGAWTDPIPPRGAEPQPLHLRHLEGRGPGIHPQEVHRVPGRST